MNAEHLVEAQRELRTRLLDREHVAWHPARELAARLLLHLDDTQFCWQFATEWLRDTLDADRVDGGFGAPTVPVYRPHAEARRATREVPSMLGASIDASDRGDDDHVGKTQASEVQFGAPSCGVGRLADSVRRLARRLFLMSGFRA